MGQALPKPALRPFLPADVPVLAEIFQASIEELAADDYSEGQREAWAAQAYDEKFAARLAEGLTLIATLDGSPIGFISLKGADHIDMFYIHPAAAGQGVGSMLYDAVEKLAGARGAEKLTADVSDNAEPFFRQRGFQAQRRNTVPLADEWLANTTMEKRFASAEDKKVSS